MIYIKNKFGRLKNNTYICTNNLKQYIMFKKTITIITALCLITTIALEVKLLFSVGTIEQELKTAYALLMFVVFSLTGLFIMNRLK